MLIVRFSVRTKEVLWKGKSERNLLIVNGILNLIKYIMELCVQLAAGTSMLAVQSGHLDSPNRSSTYRDSVAACIEYHRAPQRFYLLSHGKGHGK